MKGLVRVKKIKTQARRITEAYIGATALITAAMLVMSGIAVTKVNTEYMSTGIKAAKIVAERENEEIFVSMNGRKFAASKDIEESLKTAVGFLPAPLNAVHYFVGEIQNVSDYFE